MVISGRVLAYIDTIFLTQLKNIGKAENDKFCHFGARSFPSMSSNCMSDQEIKPFIAINAEFLRWHAPCISVSQHLLFQAKACFRVIKNLPGETL